MNAIGRRAALLAAGGMVMAGAGRAQAQAQAQAWPERDLRLVVPFPPGGTTDVVARLLAEALRGQLGRAVVVENQPGAGATLAAGRFAAQASDGHSLFLSQIASHGIAPALYRNLTYDARADFRAVALVVTVPNVWVANPGKLAGRDAKAMLREAKAKPETITFASAGNGTSTHLTGELINMLSGARMTHVPYRGAGPGMTAVIGGEVDTFIDNLPTALPQIRAGTVTALAVTAPERVPELPDVPTLAELGPEFGLAGVQAEAWFGLSTHKGTPDAVVAAMNSAVNAALVEPGLRQALAQRGTVPRGGTPEAYAALIDGELTRWARVVAEAKVTVN
jgi:tripartite-type tricarboxylate transporter receptor subunit TctC